MPVIIQWIVLSPFGHSFDVNKCEPIYEQLCRSHIAPWAPVVTPRQAAAVSPRLAQLGAVEDDAITHSLNETRILVRHFARGRSINQNS